MRNCTATQSVQDESEHVPHPLLNKVVLYERSKASLNLRQLLLHVTILRILSNSLKCMGKSMTKFSKAHSFSVSSEATISAFISQERLIAYITLSCFKSNISDQFFSNHSKKLASPRSPYFTISA